MATPRKSDALRAQAGATTLYQFVKEHIRQRIHEGVWKAGDRIPSEHELVAELGVSRMTVHRALHEMAEQGTLVRYAGIGTFVAEERPQSGLLKITNIANEIRARGHEYDCDVIQVGRESANLEVASALGVHTGESVFHALCVHRENGVPIQVEDRWVNPLCAPDYMEQDFGLVTPNEYLVKAAPLQGASFSIEALTPPREIADMLAIDTRQPCLVLRRQTLSAGQVATIATMWHPGHRYQFAGSFSAH